MHRTNLVRTTTQLVIQHAQHVQINQQALQSAVTQWIKDKAYKYQTYDQFDCHLTSELGDDTLIDYLFVLDSLNFCFWPLPDYEYDNLAKSIKTLLLADKQYFQPQNILKITPQEFKDKVFNGLDFPLIDERHRLLQDAAQVVVDHFHGQFSEIIKQAGNSSIKLLHILTSHFIGFQDHSTYLGKQVFFYKRAQILIGDIYASFNGTGYGAFIDIDQITMFPDYRVPQILQQLGVLVYDQELMSKINNKVALLSGSAEEIEIRAASVQSVELIKEAFTSAGVPMMSIEVDWMLWQIGEKERFNIAPHHRTLTVYY